MQPVSNSASRGPAAAHTGFGSKIAAILFAVAACVSVISGRLVHDGYTNYYRAIELLDMDRPEEAIVHLEDAAKAYLPYNPFVDRALDKLAILAKSAQMRGEEETSRYIWEVVRRSILSSRHFVQPHETRLMSAERAQARLVEDSYPGVDPEALVERPSEPHPLGAALLVIGLIAWLLGAAVVIWTPRGAPAWISRRWGWGISVAGLSVWLLLSAIL